MGAFLLCQPVLPICTGTRCPPGTVALSLGPSPRPGPLRPPSSPGAPLDQVPAEISGILSSSSALRFFS